MTMPTDRAGRYAQITLMLQEDRDIPGAEGLFNMALTNGLVEIYLTELPAAKSASRMPSAREILKKLRAAFAPNSDGHLHIPTDDGHVIIDIDTLEEVVEATNGVRHGREATRALTQSDVDALAALDQHPSLWRLTSEVVDRSWVRGEAEDIAEHSRAERYLEMLDKDEQARRVTLAVHVDVLADPGGPGRPELQDCPVCGHRAIVSDGGDSLGYGNTPGICLVCSYYQSPHVADEMDFYDEWEARWEHL